MESSEKKTSSRPELGRPSLLSSPGSVAPAKDASLRMLASLERDGKTPGQVSTTQARSRTRIGLIALAVVAVGGAGAFFALTPGDDAMGSSIQVAAAPHKAAAASQAVATVALSSNDAASAASSAAASTPATIEPAATPAGASSAVVAAASAPGSAGSSAAVAQAGGNPLDKLALNDAPTEPAKVRHAHDKDNRDKASAKPHEETVAAAKKTSPHAAAATAPRKARREDDADTELVAAIIARLDRRGPQPPAGASGVVVAAAPVNVSDVVRRCSQNADLLEARQCRSRACENHWGKIDACPASRAPKTSQAEGGANGQRG